MDVRKQATRFRKKYKLKAINSATLCDVLSRQGYTVIEFNGTAETEDVRNLIDALEIHDQISHSRCFTYKSDKYRIIFVHEDLNEEERTIALIHEEGHIWHGHMHTGNILGEDIVQEYEANEFAHYLLKDKTGSRKRTKLIIACMAAIVLLGSAFGVLMKQSHDEAVYADNLYRTETGEKYHLRDCMYIKDKTNVYLLTLKEFESGEYEPCGACLPEGD